MFSANARDEIAGAPFGCRRCGAAFVRGLARFAAHRSADGAAQTSAIAFTRKASVVRAALRAGRHAGFAVHSGPVVRPSGATGHVIYLDRPVGDAVGPAAALCCRRSWLRAAFLACGSVAQPHRAYHLEFVCPDRAAARSLVQTLARLSVPAGIARRRGRPVVFVRGAAATVDLLGHMGAVRAVLAFDDVLAVRATKNAIRRRVNGEAANAARSAASAARQRAAAARMRGAVGLRALTPALREAARLRLARPTATLSELAAAARPRITKPAMAARMRTLERLAGAPAKSHAGLRRAGRRGGLPKG